MYLKRRWDKMNTWRVTMQKRSLGSTEEQISIIGLGGFHLIETTDKDAEKLINTYLDAGGNYIETAADYGAGESERKVGKVMKNRRNDCFLATKVSIRDKKGAMRQFEESLQRLQTDHVDLLFFHGVQSIEELETIFASGGAAEAVKEAQKQGKTRFVGMSCHGYPEPLIKAVKNHTLDAVMTGFNFFDALNFPESKDELIPLAKSKGMGIIGMKSLADGLLWQYPEDALRFALSLPIDTMVVGCNRMDQLKKDLQIARDFTPMSDAEMEKTLTEHPFFENYVCRFCGKCLPCPENIGITGLFRLEAWYDRQLRDGIVRSTPEAALRDRLRFWFGNYERAREAYRSTSPGADACTVCGECVPRCPYGVDIPAKLKNVHYKMTRETILSTPI